MPLPASGPISFNDINVELGVAGTTQASLGQATYRTLAGVASGQISMSNFYGKSNQFAFTISANQTDANLRTLALNAGWNGTSKVVATINSGIFISSSSTGTPALTVSGSFPGGVELINNGTIVGRGGNGGNGAQATNANNGPNVGISAGGNGGTGLSVSTAITITNNNRIAGGGGGGGGGSAGGYQESSNWYENGGGGGGGGIGNSSGGSGGSSAYGRPGGSGSGGTLTSAGSGGGTFGGAAGDGGTGGGYGANGSPASPYGAGGGTAGNAVVGNSNITWAATGTRNGPIS